jgi:hypothetical protein
MDSALPAEPRCPWCGWPTEVFATQPESRHRTAAGELRYLRCLCGSWLLLATRTSTGVAELLAAVAPPAEPQNISTTSTPTEVTAGRLRTADADSAAGMSIGSNEIARASTGTRFTPPVGRSGSYTSAKGRGAQKIFVVGVDPGVRCSTRR